MSTEFYYGEPQADLEEPMVQQSLIPEVGAEFAPLGSKRRLTLLSGGSATDTLEIVPLGAGQEVGRSCVLLKFRGRTVMFDCGIHPAYSGMTALPYFDAIADWSEVDLCLVTHFHLDHSGAVPYLLGRSDFKGRIFMTHPTKPICKLLWQDYARVSKISAEENIYNKADIDLAMKLIECSTFHETVRLPDKGISFTAYRAGHVLGAAMYVVEIDGVRVLYTGDFSCELDRHLPAAEIVPAPIHALVVESTYGVQTHEPRPERERRFLQGVHEIVRGGGKCLLPVFALGRAQELLMLLEEYWERNHKELGNIPIFYATPLANKCLRIFETYTAMCSERVQDLANNCKNPWRSMKYVKNLPDATGVDWETKVVGGGPCVVLAAPGMLQSGSSRELFEMWCGEKKNGVVFTGYSVPGTLAHDLQNDPEVVLLPDGRKLLVRCSTRFVSFSAHSDFSQTHSFVRALNVPHVVLVHGEQTLMRRLRGRLLQEFPHASCSSPQNTQAVQLHFTPSAQLLAEAVGSAAAEQYLTNTTESDLKLLVEKRDGQRLILAPNDLKEFAGIHALTVRLSQSVPNVSEGFTLKGLSKRVGQVFDQLVITENALLIADAVTVTFKAADRTANLEWLASPVSDLIADSTLIMISNYDPAQDQDFSDDVINAKIYKAVEIALTEAVGVMQIVGQGTEGGKIYQVLIEDSETLLQIDMDERKIEIINEGVKGPETAEEALENVRQLMRNILASLEPTKPF